MSFLGLYCVQDLEAGSIYGLEKLWAFFYYGNRVPQEYGIELNAQVGFLYPICYWCRC